MQAVTVQRTNQRRAVSRSLHADEDVVAFVSEVCRATCAFDQSKQCVPTACTSRGHCYCVQLLPGLCLKM